MHVRQCPRCELRFTSSSELEYHLSNDHHPRPRNDDVEVVAAPHLPGSALADSQQLQVRMTMDRRPIVAAVDGSDNVDAVLAWAVDDARARQAPLHVVHSFGRVLAYGSTAMFGDLPIPDPAAARAGSEELVAAAVRRAAAAAPDLEISATSSAEDAVSLLLGLAGTTSTIVLGSRRLGKLASIVLGSVSAAVCAHASCPVVVVRDPYTPNEDRKPGVVVGVDALQDGVAALEYAFGYASRHAAALHPVLCWHPDVLGAAVRQTEAAMLGGCEARLAESLAGWRDVHPDVDVHPAITRDRPVAGLIAASAGQRLLVVGSRGRGAFAGAVLGSVSQGVLHHAACPVAVVKSASVD
jgi:nucleotide-binding universal stress UspA family protein